MQVLTFAALRLTLTETQQEHLSAPVITTRRLGVSTHSVGKARSALSMAPATMRQLLDIFFISAQQFQGYVSDVDNEEVQSAPSSDVSRLNSRRRQHSTQQAHSFVPLVCVWHSLRRVLYLMVPAFNARQAVWNRGHSRKMVFGEEHCGSLGGVPMCRRLACRASAWSPLRRR